jgi:hypothetical protein
VSKPKRGPECTICGHPARQIIEARIIAGVPYREIAPDYGFSIMAITRHINKGHMKAAIAAAKREEKRKEIEAGLNIQKCACEIFKDSFKTAKEARGKGFYGAYGSCLKPAADMLALMAKITELNPANKSGLDEIREALRAGRHVETDA